VETEQENEDEQRLHGFKEMLNLTSTSSTDLITCASTLQRAFSLSSSPGKNPYNLMTPEYQRSLTTYNTWITADASSLLLLSGKTQPEARTSIGYTHSWLSPAAFYVVESMRKEGKKVAFYGCHPGVRPDGFHDGREVVSSLAFQVLEWWPKLLRKRMAQFQSLVGSKAWKGLGDQERDGDRQSVQNNALKAWFTLLREVLVALREDGDFGKDVQAGIAMKAIKDARDSKDNKDSTVYLVVDRVDLVECPPRHFIRELVDLIKDERCLVKVLVVMDTARGTLDTEDLEGKEKVLLVLDLDQKRKGIAELSKAHSSFN